MSPASTIESAFIPDTKQMDNPNTLDSTVSRILNTMPMTHIYLFLSALHEALDY
jgi:hypothetical protein